MLSRFGKFTAASLVAGAALGLAALPADAQTAMPGQTAVADIGSNVVQAQYYGGGYRYGNRSHYRGGYRHGGRRHYRHGRRFGPDIGFGLGFGFGLAVPYLSSPYAAPYAYSAPGGYASGSLAPGSAEWVQYCSQKYNSFDPASGTYLSYSGVRRPCQVP